VGQAGTPNAVCRVWEPDPPYEWAQLRQTNPIQLGRAAGRRPWEGQMRKTNPIWRWHPGMDAGDRKTPTGSDCAKQSQFPPEQREGQVLYGKGVMVIRTCNRLPQNKANFPATPGGARPQGRGTPVKCAKQTQFAAGPSGTGPGAMGRGANRAKQSQFGQGSGFRDQ
jgi:hypothetical protein